MKAIDKNASSTKQLSNANTDVVGYDFSITGTTKSGHRLKAIIPAGTPRRQLAELFETVGYPAFLYNGKNVKLNPGQ